MLVAAVKLSCILLSYRLSVLNLGIAKLSIHPIISAKNRLRKGNHLSVSNPHAVRQ